MAAYQTIYTPTSHPEDCEHFFPCPEELGYDSDAWTGPDPADCTGCGISYTDYIANLIEADAADPVLWEG